MPPDDREVLERWIATVIKLSPPPERDHPPKALQNIYQVTLKYVFLSWASLGFVSNFFNVFYIYFIHKYIL